jgi:D-alanine-D-alanine ligase
VQYIVTIRREWERDAAGITARVERELGYPVFVKPANLGSSVGISKARNTTELVEAVRLAAEFDRKIVIEAGVPQAREIEVAVLGNDDPQASIAGEIVPSREFYDYEAKYLDDGSKPLIPAPISDAQLAEVRRMAIAAYRAVDCAGMARVDFLMNAETGALYLNEVNTIPGFTTISMYPKLWEATNLPYAELIDRLIQLAVDRHAEKQQLRTSVT